jgi:membrane fusion protein, copper/silver efflux system
MKSVAHHALLFFVIAAAFAAGAWYSQRGQVTPASGMPSAPAPVHGGPVDGGRSPGAIRPVGVTVSPEKQQLIGLRVSPVEKAPATHTLRIFGRVSPDETRVHRLNAGIDGLIREISPITTGSQVTKGEWLATFAAPDSIAAMQAYILALNATDRLAQGGEKSAAQSLPTNSNYYQRVQKLQNIGVSDLQIAEVAGTREVPQGIKILAPADGFVLARNVSPGLKFDRGAEWYRIADLSRVWILADVSRNDAEYLRPGVRVKVRLSDKPNPLVAAVAEILPQFDPATRTLKVRLEADNPGYVLRPDMFVDVELPVRLPATIAIPADAVLDSGLRRTVFVHRGDGLFEPRDVETGWRFGGRVEIVRGLTPGERIVTAGTFLLDSESRMRAQADASGETPEHVPAGQGAEEHGTHGDDARGRGVPGHHTHH